MSYYRCRGTIGESLRSPQTGVSPPALLLAAPRQRAPRQRATRQRATRQRAPRQRATRQERGDTPPWIRLLLLGPCSFVSLSLSFTFAHFLSFFCLLSVFLFRLSVFLSRLVSRWLYLPSPPPLPPFVFHCLRHLLAQEQRLQKLYDSHFVGGSLSPIHRGKGCGHDSASERNRVLIFGTLQTSL